MKNIFSCLLLTFFMLTASGQRSQLLYLETGKVISSFDYKNSEGNSLSDLKGSIQNSLGLGVRMSVLRSPWHISAGVSHKKYGASSSDEVLGNYSEWDVSYLDANVGVDYEFLKPSMSVIESNTFSFYLKGTIATDFLVNGKQRLNNQVFDLKGEEEFDRPVFFLKGGAGLIYYITRSYIAYVQYMYGRSFLFGNYDGQEQLRYLTHTVNIGFSVSLSYNRR